MNYLAGRRGCSQHQSGEALRGYWVWTHTPQHGSFGDSEVANWIYGRTSEGHESYLVRSCSESGTSSRESRKGCCVMSVTVSLALVLSPSRGRGSFLLRQRVSLKPKPGIGFPATATVETSLPLLLPILEYCTFSRWMMKGRREIKGIYSL